MLLFFKKLLPVGQQCLNQSHLVTCFLPLVFPSILFYIFIFIILLILPGAVRVLVISLFYKIIIHLLKQFDYNFNAPLLFLM